MPPTPTSSDKSNSESFATFARNLWRAWSPLQVGIATVLVLMIPSLLMIGNMHRRSKEILSVSIKSDLISSAKVMATMVDPTVHATLRERSQEQSAAYQQQIGRFTQLRPAVDPKNMIKFVYSCIEKEGEIHFVLDDTPEGDADHDGVDDKAHIMEPYTEASAALKRVFKTGIAEVSAEPYTDKWGTFLSGYAPVFDDARKVTAVLGVDLAMKDYDLQLSSLRMVSVLNAVGAVCLSIIAGLVMARYHRGLTSSFRELVTLSEAATVASRAKSDFLASMSHELRTPLNAIVGHAELLAASVSREQQSSVKEVQRAADSLLSMISDILEYSSLDASKLTVERKPVVLRTLLGELHRRFTTDAEAKGLSFDLNIDPKCPPRVMIDAATVRQVLRHVVGNAIKFTERGIVQVSANYESGGKLHFIIRDTGIGISEEKRARLFEMFDQGDMSSTRKHGGAGVGLAVCRRLCDAMSGRIWLERTSGDGSEFHIEILAEPAPESGTVWLVTQDSVVNMLVRNVAEKTGRKVVVAPDAASVNATPDDLVLVDLGSVQADGLEAKNMVAMNPGPGAENDSRFSASLPVPMKPADLRRVIENH